jgi:hypothetical protein
MSELLLCKLSNHPHHKHIHESGKMQHWFVEIMHPQEYIYAPTLR